MQWRARRAGGPAEGASGLRPPLVGALLGVLIGPLDVGLVGVALPHISATLRGDVAAGQLVMLAYVVPLAAAYVPAGALADRASTPVVLRLGLLLFAAGSVTIAAAPDFRVVLLGRVLQGTGAAAAVSGGQAVAFAALGAARAGRGLGLVHVAVALGMLGGPLLGGLLLERIAWQGLFLAEVPLALVGFALARSGRSPPHPATRTVRASKLPRRSSLLRPLGLALIVFVAMSANMFLMPYLLQRPFGLGPSAAGVLLTIVPLAILLGAIPAGDLADRYGSRWPTTAGAAVIALGIAGFALASSTHSVPAVALALIGYGTGAALFQSPNNRAVLGAAPAGALGMASGLLGMTRQAGQGVGVIVAGGLVAAAGGMDAAGSYLFAFIVLAGVAAAAAVIASLGRTDRPASAVRVETGPRRWT